MIVNTFEGRVTSPYVALDTETKTYIDGVLLSDDQIRRMCAETVQRDGLRVPRYPVSWWREHAEVRCWAYIIYAPEGFAIAETWEEFSTLLVDLRVKVGWWYYAPYDFAILDHHLLSNGWEYVEKHPQPKQYTELSNDFGSRYTMELCFPYERKKGDRSKRKDWRVRFYDLRNIFAGGLARLLREFDVHDDAGREIRKLEMDYQSASADDADAVAYMYNDAAGLWWLIQRAGARMKELYGFDIRDGRPDVLTASGLAKRVVFNEMYPNVPYWRQRRYFASQHPMSIQDDELFRLGGLLGGGLVLINPDIKAKTLKGIKAHRYDINSEYPYYMRNMRSVIGRYEVFKTLDEAREWYGDTGCYVLEIDRMCMRVRDGMIPAWRNPFTCNIESEYIITPDMPTMFFLEEFEELTKYWYDGTYHVKRVFAWHTFKEKAIERVMDREYDRKTKARVSKDAALSAFSKLVMNGYGGKYSQNPRFDVTHRVLVDGVVSREVARKDVDERMIMHVVQGARITCGGRCMLRKLAREITGGKVREHLLYTDTDSLHATCEAPEHLISSTRLGALKRENETPITEACFLAPKTYYEREASGAFEVHAKGVRKEDILALVKRGVPLSRIYKAGYSVNSLSTLTVRGGKMLLPLPKVMARIDYINDINEEV